MTCHLSVYKSHTFSITTDQIVMKKKNKGKAIRGQEEVTYCQISPEVDLIRFPVMYKYDCLVPKKGP